MCNCWGAACPRCNPRTEKKVTLTLSVPEGLTERELQVALTEVIEKADFTVYRVEVEQ